MAQAGAIFGGVGIGLADIAALGEGDRGVGIEAVIRWCVRQCDGERLGEFGVGFLRGGQGCEKILERLARQVRAHGLREDVIRRARGRAEFAAEFGDGRIDAAGLGDVALDGGAAGEEVADGVEALPAAGLGGITGGFDEGGVAAHDAAAHGAEGGIPQVGGVIVVEFGEAGDDAGFEREAAEDAA
jgi:hypothetical protein